MVGITFRTDGAWGSGQGSDLDAPTIDVNFYNLKVAIEAALTEIGDGVASDIISVSMSGTALYFHKSNGDVLGPIVVPLVAPRWRGEWAALTAYSEMDIFRVTGVGLYLVLLAHTSAATFDETATSGGDPLYLKVFGFSGASGVNLSDLGDVALTSLSDQQILVYDATSGKWVNVAKNATTTLDSLSDVVITAVADKNVLRYDTASTEWKNAALGTMADQNASAVAITGGTITGLPTPTTASAAANKAYVDAVGAAGLPGVASGDVLGNLTGSTASPTGVSLSQLLDYILSNARGAIIFRGNTGWTFLPAGTAGTFLKTGGASADPSWASPPGSGTVTSVASGTGLTGGPVTTTGTLSLAPITDGDVLANVAGSSAAPLPTTLSALLDHTLTTLRGSIIYRGSSTWAALGPGLSGKYLKTLGTGADPMWDAPVGSGTVTEIDTGAGLTGGPVVDTGTISLDVVADGEVLANISGGSLAPSATSLSDLIDHVFGATRGDVLFRNATGWAVLAPGTAGSFLQTQGSGADPAWAGVGAGAGGTTAASLWLEAADYATAAALPANTYANGTLGVGATLTGTAFGALSVDGSAVSVGNRILVNSEASASHNGVYEVTVAGNGGAAFVLTRVTDYDTTAEIIAGTAIYVLGGTANAKTSWVMTQSASVTVGTTSITFESLTIGLPLCTSHFVLGNPNSYDAPAAPVALGHLIDLILGSTQGYIAFRGATGWQGLAPGTAGYALVTGGAGADPSWSAAGSGTVTHTAGALTAHAPIVGAGSADEKALAAMTDGQLMIGHTGADPDLATLTAGANITITNAAGSITIAASSGASTLAADTDVTISSAANDDFLQYRTSDNTWHNRTHTQATAALDAMVGDSGSGGTKGLVPAPAPGDAAALKYLKADGTWAATPGGSFSGGSDVNLSSPANHDLVWFQTSDSKWHNTTFSAAIDAVFGNARGDLLFRGSSAWSVLAPGTLGQLLITAGSSGDPYWGNMTGATGSGVLPTTFLPSVDYATAAPLSANTYANGSSGVGATLTCTTNGAISVDGASPTGGQTILVKDEATASHNGVYNVTQVGSGGTPYILTRRTDFDQAAEMLSGTSCFIKGGGATNNGTSWTLIANVTTVGTDAVTFEEAGSTTAASISDTSNLSSIIDAAFGHTRGAILVRGATYWQTVNPGSAGYYLQSNGSGSDPGYVAPALSALTDVTYTTIGNNDFFVYQTSGSHWVNKTPAAATALLDTMGGDAGSGGTKGLVPAPGAGDAAASKFLKADGTWATVATGSTTLAGDTDVTITSLSDKDVLVYDSGSSKWKNQRAKYLVSAYVPGTQGDSQYLMFHRFTKAVTFPANFGAYLGHTSEAGGSTNATGSTAIGVYKAASASPNTFSSVGSITIAASGVTPTFATSGGTTLSFAQGDVLMLRAPSPADASFADFYASLVGYET